MSSNFQTYRSSKCPLAHVLRMRPNSQQEQHLELCHIDALAALGTLMQNGGWERDWQQRVD